MEIHTALTAYRLQLETLLRNNFGAVGDDLPTLTQSSAANLPDDVLDLLTRLAGQSPDPVQTAFNYGRAVERLNALKQARIAESLAMAGAEGVPLDALPPEELDTMARVLAVRDRLVKAIADFTFKALMVCLGLLVVWLLLQVL